VCPLAQGEPAANDDDRDVNPTRLAVASHLVAVQTLPSHGLNFFSSQLALAPPPIRPRNIRDRRMDAIRGEVYRKSARRMQRLADRIAPALDAANEIADIYSEIAHPEWWRRGQTIGTHALNAVGVFRRFRLHRSQCHCSRRSTSLQ
jgi:hypothetical protein